MFESSSSATPSSVQGDYNGSILSQINNKLGCDNNCPDPTTPIQPLTNAIPYGSPYGTGYVSPVTVTIKSVSGKQAQIFVDVQPDGSIDPTSLIIQVAGSGYQIGDQISFNGYGNTGWGAYAYVGGIVGGTFSSPNDAGTFLGNLTQVTFPPSGLVNQIIAFVTGRGGENSYVTNYTNNVVSTYTIPPSGIIQAFSNQVSSYYSASQFYQGKIQVLTTCLGLVSAGDYTGTGTITFSTWPTTTTYLSQAGTYATTYSFTTLPANLSIQNFMSQYASAPLNTSLEGTVALNINVQTINSAVSPLQNSLNTEQSYSNSSLTALQSQISLYNQIFTQHYNTLQSIANAI